MGKWRQGETKRDSRVARHLEMATSKSKVEMNSTLSLVTSPLTHLSECALPIKKQKTKTVLLNGPNRRGDG